MKKIILFSSLVLTIVVICIGAIYYKEKHNTKGIKEINVYKVYSFDYSEEELDTDNLILSITDSKNIAKINGVIDSSKQMNGVLNVIEPNFILEFLDDDGNQEKMLFLWLDNSEMESMYTNVDNTSTGYKISEGGKRILQNLILDNKELKNEVSYTLENYSDINDLEKMQSDGLVVYLWNEVPMHMEKVQKFYDDSKNNINGHVTIVRYTIEGDPIVEEYHYFDNKYILYLDTREDNYGEKTIYKREIDDVELTEEKGIKYLRTKYCEFVRTYTVVRVEPSDNKYQEYVTLKQFQFEEEHMELLPISTTDKLKKGYSYEFTFSTSNLYFDANIKNVFVYAQVLNWKKTNKTGLDQIQDPICKE